MLTPVTHRGVLKIAVPIMLSNVSEPLIGVVNTAVIGRLPEAYYIGAIATASLIFSFVFWGFGFLRLSTSGLAAQSVGARDRDELVSVIGRALVIAVSVGILLIIVSPAISKVGFDLMGGSPEVRSHAQTYFDIRIWSAPFALANYCFLGWFIGQGKAKVAFLVQLFLNVANMSLSIFFVLGLGMTSAGVGYAVLIAEIAASILGLALVLTALRSMGARFNFDHMLDRAKIVRTLMINGDIMIRSLCLVFAFTWFTARGARAGDVVLAANVVLMNFFEVASFMIDGFAYASEALVGQSIGAKDRPRFRAAVHLTSIWAGVVGIVCGLIILFCGPFAINAMTVNPEVRDVARHYLYWAALAPVLGTVCFQFDGIFTGATQTADMRNMMIASLAIFLVAWWFLEPAYGNHGLWAAINIFFIARGITYAMRMPALERAAFDRG